MNCWPLEPTNLVVGMRVPARWAGLGAPLALWAGPLVWKLEQHLSPARSNTLRCLRIECLSVGIRPIFPDCACLSINFSRPRYWFTRRRGQGVEIVQESPHLVPLGADLPAEDDLSPTVRCDCEGGRRVPLLSSPSTHSLPFYPLIRVTNLFYGIWISHKPEIAVVVFLSRPSNTGCQETRGQPLLGTDCQLVDKRIEIWANCHSMTAMVDTLILTNYFHPKTGILCPFLFDLLTSGIGHVVNIPCP